METRWVLGTGDVCVLVPVYNEAPVLAGVVTSLVSRFGHVVCVDDGSTDGSGLIAAESGAFVLRHAVNLGAGAAVRTGFEHVLRHTDARYVVTFDGDGQHSPLDAEAMVEVARRTGVDVVLGTRAAGPSDGQPRARRLLLRAGLAFSRGRTGLALTDTHNGLRVLSRDSLRKLELRQLGMAHASELEAMISTHRLTWVEVPVSVVYTDYSRGKGQRNLNAVNVLVDLAMARIRAS